MGDVVEAGWMWLGAVAAYKGIDGALVVAFLVEYEPPIVELTCALGCTRCAFLGGLLASINSQIVLGAWRIRMGRCRIRRIGIREALCHKRTEGNGEDGKARDE